MTQKVSKLHRLFSGLVVAVGSGFFCEEIASYLIYLFRFLPNSALPSEGSLSFETFLMSSWLVGAGLQLGRKNENAQNVSALLFAGFWLALFVLFRLLNMDGFVVEPLTLRFPSSRSDRILFLLDSALCLWIAARAGVRGWNWEAKDDGVSGAAIARTSEKVSKLTTWILMISLLASAGAVRFYKLSSIGLSYPDDYFYTTAAYRWSIGVFYNCWGKPGYHLLGAAAMKVFGVHDYSLAYLNGLCDIFNVLLVFLIARRLGMNRTVSFGSAFVYAFVPFTVLVSRTALTHSSSITFLLLSFLMLLNYLMKEKKTIYLVLAGLSLGYSGNIHPTLICLAPLYGLAVSIPHLRRIALPRNILTLVAQETILAISFVATFAGFTFLIRTTSSDQSGLISVFLHDVIGRLFIHRSHVPQARMPDLHHEILYSFKLIGALTSPLLLAVIVAALALHLIWIVTAFLKRDTVSDVRIFQRNLVFAALAWLCGLWLIVCVSFVYRKPIPIPPIFMIGVARLLLPALPFLIIAAFFSIHLMWKGKKTHFRVIILCVCVSLMADLYATWARQTLPRMPLPSPQRTIADKLEGKVSSQQRLLIAPSFINQECDPFSLYISGNYYCLPWKNSMGYPRPNSLRCLEQTDSRWIEEKYEYIPSNWDPAQFLSYLEEQKIRYVVVNNRYAKAGRSRHSLPPKEEIECIVKILESIQADLIFESFLTLIYALPPDLHAGAPPPSTLSTTTLIPES